MVSIYSIRKNTLLETPTYQVELRGLSTDTKPTELDEGVIENGSVFIAIDTQDVYLYDGENEEWLPSDEDIQDVENLDDNKNDDEQRKQEEVNTEEVR